MPESVPPPSVETVIMVPARLASQRFPRKLLHEIAGRPLILRTADRLRSELPDWRVVYAVADEELATVLEKEGCETVMTDPSLASGTDRLAEANRQIGARYIINVQADEPLVKGAEVRLLAGLVRGDVDISTLATPFHSEEAFQNPNRVKVVCDQEGQALYFSRSPIPHRRGGEARGAGEGLWHLGLYAYRAEALERFSKLAPSRLELIEKLEQLRALENGMRIAVGVVEEGGIGIDTLEDVQRYVEATELGEAQG